MRDTSVDAFTPTLGFASSVTSIIVMIFLFLIAIVFWIASLETKEDWSPAKKKVKVVLSPAEKLRLVVTRFAMGIVVIIFCISSVEYVRGKIQVASARKKPKDQVALLKAEEEKKLNASGPTDQPGVLQIPIKRAIELTAEKYKAPGE